MEAPVSSEGKRCSWCGTLNALSEKSCFKCGAVLSLIQATVVNQSAAPQSGVRTEAEGNQTPEQDVVSALVDSSLFDKISAEAMSNLGLRPTFVSGQTLAFLVAGCLSLYILLRLVSALADISQIGLSSKAADVLWTPSRSLTVSEIGTLLIHLSLLGVALLTAVTFLAWIYRAHKNLKALGATGLKYSPGWAIGGFFVPILNIVRPYQVVMETWKASAAAARRSDGNAWTYQEAPMFIALWWGAWLISGFLRSFSAIMVFGTGETNQHLVASRFLLVYDVISITSAALAITVVLKINSKQEVAHKLNSSTDVDRILDSLLHSQGS